MDWGGHRDPDELSSDAQSLSFKILIVTWMAVAVISALYTFAPMLAAWP
jgi:hypothetical protein